jgi:hypothetical protein
LRLTPGRSKINRGNSSLIAVTLERTSFNDLGSDSLQFLKRRILK